MVAQHRLLAVATLVLVASSCDDTASRIPAPSSLSHQNAASVEAFQRAYIVARTKATAENVGALAMLYHAYAFFDQARACYALARELDPDAFRWVYYQAQLEKTTFEYEAAEALFLDALERRPESAELHAELGDLYLMWSRPDDARPRLEAALALEPVQPVASLGTARLLTLSQDYEGVLEVMTPLLERHPRLSKAHQFAAAAYGALGDAKRAAFHQEEGEYGSAVESELMLELHELAVPAIVDGEPDGGAELLTVKCARCHDHERIYDQDRDRMWWARTVRRMQREAGWQWLTDDEASTVVAYLAERELGR